jgi:hypothetical protein
MSRPFRLNRRAVLRGAGGIAIALPWLEIMAPEQRSLATTTPAQRFLTVFQPNGTVLERFRPTGTETSFTLSPILSPFEDDVSRNFFADRMFMGAQGVGRLGVMERDPLMVQGERKLINQAEQLIVLVDSSKFAQRSSLIVCALERVHTIITDDAVSGETAAMIEAAGVKLIVAETAVRNETLPFPESA